MTAHCPGFNKKWQGKVSLIGPNLEINIAFYHCMKDVKICILLGNDK